MKQISTEITPRQVDRFYLALNSVLKTWEDKCNLSKLADRLDDEGAANMTKVRKMLDFVHE